MGAKTVQRSGKQHRTFSLERAGEPDEESRSVRVAFSSEVAVDRMFGREILDHSPDSVDLDRLNDGAPLLSDHDTSRQVGVIEDATICEDGVGRATVRFSKSPDGEREWQDVRDNIRQKISVGYLLNDEGERDPDNDDGKMKAYRFRDWTPYEISLVSVPADNSVGVGRSDEEDNLESRGNGTPSTDPVPTTNKNTMSDDKNGVTVTAPEPSAEQIRTIEEGARKHELERCNNLRAFAKRASVTDSDLEKAISDGTEFETFTRSFAEGAVATCKPSSPMADLEIGMNQKERGRFSIVKGIRELSRGKELSGLEKEVSEQIQKQAKLEDGQGRLHLPLDILAADLNGHRRDLEAGVDAEGGYSVQTDLGGIVELLRNKMCVAEAGSTQITGLQGNLSLPRADGAASASWVDEEGSVSDTAQTFGQLALTPNRLASRTAFSDQLLAQSSIGIEAFVRDDLTRVIAIAFDLAALHGSGASNQPLGLDGTSGIGTLTYGGAPTWADVVEHETDVAAANGFTGNASFILSASSRGKWKTTVKVASSDSVMLMDSNNEANGYPVRVSENVTGNVSFFGVWNQLIMATWGAMSIIVDSYSKAATGQRVITVNSFHDVACRQPSSFCVSADAANQ